MASYTGREAASSSAGFPGGYTGGYTGGYAGGPAYEQIEGDSLTKYVKSMQNLMAAQGQQTYGQGQALLGPGMQVYGQGQQGYQAGLGAMAPTLQYLTQLTKGDQADVSQAIQPEANRIKDSFAAVRNMISAQPRGGGKAGVLAEAPYKEQQQIGDLASQARQGAAGQLGQFASTMAGLGLSQAQTGNEFMRTGLAESELGQQGLTNADQMALQRRQQNIASGGKMGMFVNLSEGLSNMI